MEGGFVSGSDRYCASTNRSPHALKGAKLRAESSCWWTRRNVKPLVSRAPWFGAAWSAFSLLLVVARPMPVPISVAFRPPLVFPESVGPFAKVLLTGLVPECVLGPFGSAGLLP